MKKTIEIKELKEKDTKALARELKDLEIKLADLKFKSSFRKLKNYHEITATRKRIARIWTILGEKIVSKIKEAK